ncbi:hypothetical protein PsunGV_gp040 [Pseudalatia unipuncta granulovirus]|uniref:Uncharacterized protein n=1 Tax=Pseudalatia unipuncta granulosis virus TaxID=36355 RepID=B6S6Q9_GVPU|nr:hypothetical protein PsunGV_gp040 [Pseudalatia unipuncta granulovirus]ACH69390.1 unknown [Pseudalatia unipuncta granulovirus]
MVKMLMVQLVVSESSTMSDVEEYSGYSSVESSGDDESYRIDHYYVRNNRYKLMSNTYDDMSTESEESCSSQFEASSDEEQDEDCNDFGRPMKRIRRTADIPYDIHRYTPELNMNDIRDIGRKYYFQNDAIMCINGIGVNKQFCLCTTNGVNRARLHMKKSMNFFQFVLSPRRFLLVVFSFIYLLTLHHEYELPQYRQRHKHVCQKCTMLEWWIKSYNNETADMILFLYVNYVAPQQFKHKCIVNSIERYLLKKYSSAYLPCYIETTFKYMNKFTANLFVNKILFLLYRYGAKMSESSADFNQNQLVKLYILCGKYNLLRTKHK